MKSVVSVLDLCFCHVLGDSRDRFTIRSRFVSVTRYKFSARLRGLLFSSLRLDYCLVIFIFSTRLWELLHNLKLCNPDYLTPTLDGFQWGVYVLMFVPLSGDDKKIWSNPSYLVQKDVPPAVPSKAATQDLETKTTATHSSRSPSSSSITIIVTTSPTPRQPDLLRFRLLKTDLDYHCYSRHFGYCLVTVTVTDSWVTGTLIALGNLNLKNSSSCYSHVLMNIGLDLIQSLPCALTHTGVVLKTSLALVVCSSPLRERRRSSETVFRSEGNDLIGKNWWRYYNLNDFGVILKNLCKVSDFQNRFYQYIF